MPQKTSPFIQGKYGWTFGESGWHTGMDENLLKFSYLHDRNVDGIVAELPTPPVNGTAYFNTTDNAIYFVVDGTYYTTPVPQWFEFHLRSDGTTYQFDGDSVNVVPSTEDLSSQFDALGTAAYNNTEDFANAANLADIVNPALGAALVGYKGRTLANKLSDIINVKDYGAKGDGVTDDTAAIQSALTSLGAVTAASRRDLNRTLDLAGKSYIVSAPLSLAGCDGVRISNGTLIVDKTKPFESGRAVLEHLVANTELWGFAVDGVTIQCNQVANGINIQRHQAFKFYNSIILGWGQREYGLQMGPNSYSADACVINPRISGFSVSYADNPVATRTGTGIISNTGDTMIIGGNIDTGKKCISITSSTSIYLAHVWNGSPGSEANAEPNNVGIDITGDAAVAFVGNTFDNCCIVMNGQCLYKHIVGNKFYSNQTQLLYPLILKATATGQAIADLNFQDNQMHGYYDKPVMVDQTNGTYTTLARTFVCNNPIRSFTSANAGYPVSLTATNGTIILPVTTGFFNSDQIVKFNLGARALLLPTYDDVLAVSASIYYTSAQTTNVANGVQWVRYDKATGILSIKCTAAFNGRLKIDFDQTYASKLWTPEVAS